VLIWHGALLHGGTQVHDAARTRKSYVTHYTSLNAYPKAHHFTDAFTAERFTSLNGGYVFEHPWVRKSRTLPSWAD
jgi:phytanoyl-CoA hydroxylase